MTDHEDASKRRSPYDIAQIRYENRIPEQIF